MQKDLVPARVNNDTMISTSIELFTMEEKQDITDSWWWLSWPWLMVLLMAVSLVGLLWINRRQQHLADR